MINQSTALEGGAMPSTQGLNPLTQSDIDKQLKRMEYDMAKERVEPYIVDMTKELPEVCRNEPFERFAFCVNEAGIPEVCPLPMEGGASERHPAIALLEDEYGGAIERTTLIRKLTETQGIKQGTAAMQVQRLIGKGSLVVDGRMVQLPEITKSQNNIITGGGGDVIDVIKCDKEIKEFKEIEDCPF